MMSLRGLTLSFLSAVASAAWQGVYLYSLANGKQGRASR